MKKTIYYLILLLLTAGTVQARTLTVTSTYGGYTPTDPNYAGSFHQLYYNTLVSGDTLTFADGLDEIVLTVAISRINNLGNGRVTILGNGATISSNNKRSITFAGGGNQYSDSIFVENLNIKNCYVNITSPRYFRMKNCTFTSNEDLYIRTGTNSNTTFIDSKRIFEGCLFEGKDASGSVKVQIGISSNGSNITNNLTEFVSCTFINKSAQGVITTSGSNHPTKRFAALTNCVIIDKNASASRPSVDVDNIDSKGFNVVQGVATTQWNVQGSDVFLAQDADAPLLEEDGVYKVVENYAAYNHLPANTSIEGIDFPEKDLLGTTIDYTQPTHSGAVQQTISTGIGNIAVTGVSLNITEAQTLNITETLQLTATVTPEDATNKTVIWESDNTAVASVSANGLVTAVGEGTAVIKVITADGGFEATLTVNVNAPTHVTSITLDKHTATLDTYETLQLTAAVLPSDATYPQYTWESSNTAVAAVSASGLVTPIAYGTADITVRTTDGGLTDVCSVTVEKLVYNNGVIFVNEDWFGHRNSSINYLKKDGSWVYEVYRTINNKLLGCTTQYGTIYADKLFLTSKQDEDGDGIGSRFAVCDAQSMESLAEFRTFPEGGDGRAFLGVNEHKGYIGTSNGIYVFDIDNLEFTGRIEDTEGDDNGEGNLPGQNPGLYTGQIGSIRQAGNNVFAIHQVDGLLVINPQTDVVENVLDDYHYATLIVGPDGNLYASATAQQAGGGLEGATLPIIIKINPWTLETSEIAVPEGFSAPYASWGAWRDDAFYASEKENKLYWKTGNDWDSKMIYSYDITNETFEKPIDLSTYDNGTWGIYGSGMGIDPLTNEIYAGVLIQVQDPSYRTLKINPETGDITTYMMRDNWWFPAMALFPDNEAPVIVEELNELTLEADDTENRVYLGDKVTDIDNLDAAIIKSIILKEGENLISARVWRDSLIVTPLRTVTEDTQTTLTLKANSNGKVVEKTLTVTLKADICTGYNIPKLDISVYPNPFVDHFVVTASTSTQASITDLSGKTLIRTVLSAGSNRINTSALPSGVYVLKAGEKMVKLVK